MNKGGDRIVVSVQRLRRAFAMAAYGGDGWSRFDGGPVTREGKKQQVHNRRQQATAGDNRRQVFDAQREEEMDTYIDMGIVVPLEGPCHTETE